MEDQLGLVLSPKSKIEDGSTVGTSLTHRTAVADFWFPYSVELQLILRFAPLSAPADPQCRSHRIGILPTSLTAATELSRAKSISETSTSTHRIAALNSSDIVARVGINEAMLTPVAEWRTRCRVDVREEKS